MKTPKNKIPVGTAKTAYGRLSEVAALALDEPLRIAMGTWLDRGVAGKTYTWIYPACGTVGCVGGWTEAIDAAKQKGQYRIAERILGLTGEQADELFYPAGLCATRNQQTRAHARRVVLHIRRFQKKYRKQLLAHKI